MRRILVVSTPALLEARNLARWISRERVPGVRIAPSRGEWGVFAPAQYAERARRAFRKSVAANNPGSHRVVFKIRATDPYTTMKRRYTFGRSMQIADMLVKGIVLKAAVLDGKGKVRFVAFKKTGRVASNPGMEALADAAVMMAARGARQYLDTHKLTADPAALTSCLKSWVKIKFPEALKDAKDAISAGMHAVAEQTFAATMRLAGIEAAKEAARAPGTNRARRNQPNKPRFYQDSMGKIHDWNTGAVATLPVSPVVVMSYRTKPPGLFRTWRGGGERHWDYLGPSAERSPVTNTRHRSNPHAQVPIELQGQAYASRFAGYLRKRGIRCSMKRVADRPGWWAFFVRPSQLQKAEALEWEWMKVSDPEETRRMEIKGRAAFRRWRRRVQRRPRRRGERKEGYFRGGVAHPHRTHRNASIESKWPTMTDRQRREALRIIGIQEEIAELWSSKSWSALSSVVKTLLLRSWKHGGDTTKIRRVPVGAR